FVGDGWDVLGTTSMDDLMPPGWRGNKFGGVVMKLYRTLTTRRLVVGALLLALPLLWWLTRRHWLAPFVVVATASAAIGALAGYYGDSIEMSRHCWGAAQQLLFGAFLLIAIALDRHGS